MQGNMKDYSENIPTTCREHKGLLREHSDHMQGNIKDYSENIPTTCRET
jgi:hypothetical protein